MTQRCSPQAAPQASAPKLFAALPPEVLNHLGQWLSKTDRNSLTRAVPGLNYHGAALWKDDLIYDHMVPRTLQHDALEAPAASTSQQPEQAWAQLWRRLHSGSKNGSHASAVQVQAAHVGRIRRSERHDIQTVVPLCHEMQVLTIGRMPSAEARQAGELRRGHAFSLLSSVQPAASDVPTHNAATWPSSDVAISSKWRRPKTLVPAGCNGLMAVLDPHDALSIWQYDRGALMVLPFQNPDFTIRATQVAFTRVGHAPRAIFYGDYAYGREGTPSEEEDFLLHGLNICPPGQVSDFPYLEMVRGKAAALPAFVDHAAPDASNTRHHLSVNGLDGAALLVSDQGEVTSQRLPFVGAQGVLEQFLPAQSFNAACLSAGGTAVALADGHGHVQVMRRTHGQLKPVWTLAKPRPIKQMALNADGSRLGLLRQDGCLDVWSLLPRAKGPLTTAGRLMCRIQLGGQAIISFDFSPYCHALLVSTQVSTRLVLPLHKQFVVELPHLAGSGVFVPGMLRIVGVHDAALVDIDVAAPKA